MFTCKRNSIINARITTIWGNIRKKKFKFGGYFKTKQEALKELAAYNDTPHDLEMSKVTFQEIYRRWFSENFDEDSNRSTIKNYTAAHKYCKQLYDMKIADIFPHNMHDIIVKYVKNE